MTEDYGKLFPTRLTFCEQGGAKGPYNKSLYFSGGKPLDYSIDINSNVGDLFKYGRIKRKNFEDKDIEDVKRAIRIYAYNNYMQKFICCDTVRFSCTAVQQYNKMFELCWNTTPEHRNLRMEVFNSTLYIICNNSYLRSLIKTEERMFAFSMCGGIVREEINIFPWSGYWIITTPYESYAIDSPFKISVKDNIVYLYHLKKTELNKLPNRFQFIDVYNQVRFDNDSRNLELDEQISNSVSSFVSNEFVEQKDQPHNFKDREAEPFINHDPKLTKEEEIFKFDEGSKIYSTSINGDITYIFLSESKYGYYINPDNNEYCAERVVSIWNGEITYDDIEYLLGDDADNQNDQNDQNDQSTQQTSVERVPKPQPLPPKSTTGGGNGDEKDSTITTTEQAPDISSNDDTPADTSINIDNVGNNIDSNDNGIDPVKNLEEEDVIDSDKIAKKPEKDTKEEEIKDEKHEQKSKQGKKQEPNKPEIRKPKTQLIRNTFSSPSGLLFGELWNKTVEPENTKDFDKIFKSNLYILQYIFQKIVKVFPRKKCDDYLLPYVLNRSDFFSFIMMLIPDDRNLDDYYYVNFNSNFSFQKILFRLLYKVNKLLQFLLRITDDSQRSRLLFISIGKALDEFYEDMRNIDWPYTWQPIPQSN